MVVAATVSLAGGGGAQAEDVQDLARRAEQSLDKAIRYLRTEVAVEGGYLWRYSEDLTLREGERLATATQAWVQPPGTPAVGLAFVEAYEATGSEEAREAFVETANALVRGQLRSGGWQPVIEFDPALRSKYSYRVDRPVAGAINGSTLDDNMTQSAVIFLMRADKALAFKNAKIHEAATYALRELMDVQYANGAWPHRFGVGIDRLPGTTKRAEFPRGPIKPWDRNGGGSGQYTFNDQVMARTMELFLTAGDIYDKPEYLAVAKKTGDFYLQAQFPEPQPGWAQQYDGDMQAAWARVFEPPSLATGETQGVLFSLLLLYERTGDAKYLNPLPATIAWLRRSAMKDGRLPRFVEFKTNEPLFVNNARELTNSSHDAYKGYGWFIENQADAIEKRYERSLQRGAQVRRAPERPKGKVPEVFLAAARKAVETLDDRGRWVENGTMRQQGTGARQMRILNMSTTVKNLSALAKLLSYTDPQ